MTDDSPVRQLRIVITAPDYEAALTFFRDALGMTEVASFSSDGGHVSILDAGRATIEIADPAHAAFIDDVEVGRRVAGHIRVALEVDDSAAMTDTLAEAGATVVAPPVRTPWKSLNSRLDVPGGIHLTLFTEPVPDAS